MDKDSNAQSIASSVRTHGSEAVITTPSYEYHESLLQSRPSLVTGRSSVSVSEPDISHLVDVDVFEFQTYAPDYLESVSISPRKPSVVTQESSDSDEVS